MQSNRPLWLVFAPVVFLLLWSGGYAVAKVGLQFAQPMTLLSLRFGIVVALMAVLFAILRPPLPATCAEWGHLAVVGFLIQAIYFGMCYFALHAGVAAGTVALLLSLQPVIVALIAPRWAGERASYKAWVGLGLGLAGCAVVIVVRSTIEAPSLFGFVCAVLGLAGIVGGSLWEKKFGLTHHPVTTNLIGYVAGLLGVLPLMFLLEIPRISWTWEFTAVLKAFRLKLETSLKVKRAQRMSVSLRFAKSSDSGFSRNALVIW